MTVNAYNKYYNHFPITSKLTRTFITIKRGNNSVPALLHLKHITCRADLIKVYNHRLMSTKIKTSFWPRFISAKSLWWLKYYQDSEVLLMQLLLLVVKLLFTEIFLSVSCSNQTKIRNKFFAISYSPRQCCYKTYRDKVNKLMLILTLV